MYVVSHSDSPSLLVWLRQIPPFPRGQPHHLEKERLHQMDYKVMSNSTIVYDSITQLTIPDDIVKLTLALDPVFRDRVPLAR